MALIDIPVRKVKVRMNGEDVDCFEMHDFWRVWDENNGIFLSHTSNPLIIWHDVVPGNPESTPQERLLFRFVADQPSQDGQGENGTDVTYDLYNL